MRWFASTAALAGSLLLAGTASASSTYPDAIKSHLSLKNKPDCALCHSGGMTGFGTVNTLFGTTARTKYNLTSGNTTLLMSVLDKMKTDKVDSDGDKVGDIDELVAGTDPNTAGGGVVAAKPDLTYGCVASVAPGGPTPSSGAAFGLALIAAIAVARRRRGFVGPSNRSLATAVATAAAVALIGCYDVSYVTSDICPSGLAWTAGDRASPNMHPGLACVDCHAQNGGPKFAVAGTVFAATAPDDCLGAKATIVITDADGKVLEIGANESGNFYTELAVKTPYQAKIVSVDKKKSKIMFSSQSTGDCNSCHTVAGANGAPGRITLP